MRRTTVPELCNDPTGLFASDDVVVVESQDRTIGYYVPVKAKDPAAVKAAIADLRAVIDDILETSDLDEESLALAFDFTRPMSGNAPDR